MCPKGDDPFTTFNDYHTITITTSATAPLSGEFKFIFQGEYFYFPSNASQFDDEDCSLAFNSLPNIESATCVRGVVDPTKFTTQYTIKIHEFPLFPYENNIYSHDGNPSLGAYECDLSHITSGNSPTCSIQIISTGTLPGMS